MKGYSCQIVVDEAIDWLDKKRDADAALLSSTSGSMNPTPSLRPPTRSSPEYGALNNQAAIYNGTIDNTDRAIGRLVAKLEATRRARQHHHSLLLRQRQLPPGSLR